MRVFINDTTEIKDVGSVLERFRDDNEYSLEIIINDLNQPLNEVKTLFMNVTKVDIIREDLNGEKRTITYDQYTKLDKVQRKLVDETDTTIISLIKPTN